MNRADEHRKFCAAYRALVPSETPERVEEAFARWWAREGHGHETAMERGERVHREAEALCGGVFQPVKIDESRIDDIESKIKKMKESQALARPVLMVHDEVIWDVPTNLTNARPAYRCENKSCPERPPVHADKAPKCYTCDRPMSAHDPADLMLSRDGNLEQSLVGIADMVERIKNKVASAIGIPSKYLEPWPLKAEADLDGWYMPPDIGSPMWGPSPLGFGPPAVPFVEQLTELRNMTPQAWGRYMRGENPPPQIPRKPKDDKEERYRAGDAIRHQILIGTGEVLDKIGRIAFGLFRAEAVPGTEIQRETDESFRGRLLAYMEPRQLPAGEERHADPGEKIWKAIPDARPRKHTVKSLLDKLDQREAEIRKQMSMSARGTKDDVIRAFGMIDDVKDVLVENPEPGHVHVILKLYNSSNEDLTRDLIRGVERDAREVVREQMPVGVAFTIRIVYSIDPCQVFEHTVKI